MVFCLDELPLTKRVLGIDAKGHLFKSAYFWRSYFQHMLYRLIPFDTSPLLQSLLYDVYELKTQSEPVVYSTTPNGIIGISVNLSGNSAHKIDNTWCPTKRNTVYGLINTPDVLQISPHFREIAIGFKPFFFQLMTNIPMAQIVGQANLSLEEILHPSIVAELEESLQKAASDDEIIAAIEKCLRQCIDEQYFDKRMLEAMNLIYSNNVYNVDTLSKAVNLSTTALRHLFYKGIGRSPKEVAKIIRFNKLIRSFNPHKKTNLQDVVFDNGYFDQAHMTRDFTSVLGITPRQYFNNTKCTFDFYNYKRWTGDILAMRK